MIAIVDYGVGNLFSLSSSVRSLGAEVRVTRDAADLRAADHILLPGAGRSPTQWPNSKPRALCPFCARKRRKSRCWASA